MESNMNISIDKTDTCLDKSSPILKSFNLSQEILSPQVFSKMYTPKPEKTMAIIPIYFFMC